MGAIYKRELKAYFTGMIGYAFIAAVLLFIGIYTTAYNLKYMYPMFEYVIDSSTILYVIVVPILTMRVLAEERRQKTDQLIYSLPLRLTDVVLGKYLAMATLLAIPMAVVSLYPLMLSRYGTLSLGTAYSAIAGFFLLGCCLIAIGLFMSSVTDSQLVAAVASFAALILCFLMSGITQLLTTTAVASLVALTVVSLAVGIVVRLMTGSLSTALLAGLLCEVPLVGVYMVRPAVLEGAFAQILSALAAFDQLSNFLNGVFDLTAVVYFVSVTVLFLFFSVQSVEKRRWS